MILNLKKKRRRKPCGPGVLGLHYLRNELGQNPSLLWPPVSSVIKFVYLQMHVVVPVTTHSGAVQLGHGNYNVVIIIITITIIVLITCLALF